MNLLNDATLLVSQLEQQLGGTSPKNKPTVLPSVSQIFEIGKLMFRLLSSTDDQSTSTTRDTSDLLLAYQHLIESLPETYLKKSFTTIQKALLRLLSDNSPTELLTDTSQSLSGLFSNSPLLCKIISSKEWISSLAALYDRFILLQDKQQQSEEDNRHDKDAVLSSVSFLILDGIFLQRKQQGSSNETIQLLMEAMRTIEEQSMDCLYDLQQWQQQYEPYRRNLQSAVKKLPTADGNDDDTEELRDYLLNMLESASSPARQQQQDQQQAKSKAMQPKQTPPPTTTKISPTDEVERRIEQIKQILPDFGDGFLESALSINHGDVEATVTCLLQDPSQYPPTLRVIDTKLPRRRGVGNKQKELEESQQARQLVKERVAIEDEREQERYKALLYVAEQEEQQVQEENANLGLEVAKVHNEYDDDYDDQYDDNDHVELGATDSGYMDMDQVRLYNQAAKAEEAESSFWEQNRNTNRQPANNNNSEGGDGGGGKQWGPDKIKGGRIIGPDGKIIRNNHNRNKKKGGGGGGGGGNKQQQPNQQQNNNNKVGGGNNSTKNQQGSGGGGATAGGNNKPKTKPKNKNRFNKQRDKKQKAQGTFGAGT